MSELTSNEIVNLSNSLEYPIDFESNIDALLSDSDSFYKLVKKNNNNSNAKYDQKQSIQFADMKHAVSWLNAMTLSTFLDGAERLLYSRLGRQSQPLTKIQSLVIGQINAELLDNHFSKYKPFQVTTDFETITVHGERHSIPIKCHRYKLLDYEKGLGLPALITLNWQALEDVIENNDKILDTTVIRYIDITFRANTKTGIVDVDYLMLSQPQRQ
ncbi:hypothetical protein PPL_07573 [Heterostelium album PN500]|uniref:Uncharacterized protein n=1 Tax=Heterostelium pallidum (strain ATCC 26659 / Pp 5 / PN500) TaxID=670386 RepID=D3BGC2_HETP5|nr:hypothetical protein PPL_07573 [Heterostelium album PN500]EFA79522.1 hypothetical protein PPL_07573 [Heterostelium album PN500]|eukprot:XP_020431643.1 hypothetical protein PPL_07573 [Heterostelium album PN500]